MRAGGQILWKKAEPSRLLFADDLVLLSSTEFGLQRALNSFADACNYRRNENKHDQN